MCEGQEYTEKRRKGCGCPLPLFEKEKKKQILERRAKAQQFAMQRLLTCLHHPVPVKWSTNDFHSSVFEIVMCISRVWHGMCMVSVYLYSIGICEEHEGVVDLSEVSLLRGVQS